MSTTPTTPASQEGKIYAIAERQPEFPCWLWASRSLNDGWWWHCSEASVFAYEAETDQPDKATHWHPDQSEAPTATPQDSVGAKPEKWDTKGLSEKLTAPSGLGVCELLEEIAYRDAKAYDEKAIIPSEPLRRVLLFTRNRAEVAKKQGFTSMADDLFSQRNAIMDLARQTYAEKHAEPTVAKSAWENVVRLLEESEERVRQLQAEVTSLNLGMNDAEENLRIAEEKLAAQSAPETGKEFSSNPHDHGMKPTGEVPGMPGMGTWEPGKAGAQGVPEWAAARAKDHAHHLACELHVEAFKQPNALLQVPATATIIEKGLLEFVRHAPAVQPTATPGTESAGELIERLNKLLILHESYIEKDNSETCSTEKVFIARDKFRAAKDDFIASLSAQPAKSAADDHRELLSIALTAIERSLDGALKFDGYYRYHHDAATKIKALGIKPIKERSNGL